MASSTDDMTDSEPDARIDPQAGDPLPPPIPPSTPGHPPLRRATYNKEWLGVAEGLSRYLGVSVGVVRLAFVVTTFLGGLGIVVYLLAAALIPKDGEANALGDRIAGGRSEVLLVLIGALALTVVGIMNGGDSDLAFAGVLIIGGLALWAHSTGRLTASTFALPPEAGAPLSDAPPSMYAPWTAAPPLPVPVRVKKSARLGLATLAASVVTMIVLAPWSSPWRVVSIGFAILALGLVAGWILRKRVWFLILPLLALVPVLPAAAFYSRSGVPLNAGTGELNLTTADLSGRITSRRLSAGHITFDLSTLAESRSVNVAVGAGQIDIVVPQTARVVVRARTGAGNLDVFGTETAGIGVEVDRTIEVNETALTIVIDAKVGMGRVAVRRAGAKA
jgi:phage shock protein PspC (stress-responsive transcriptional regulator)